MTLTAKGAGTDELVIAARPQRSWGLPVALDLSLQGAGAGLIAVAALFDLGSLLLGGLLAIMLSVALLMGHLGRPERFWRAASRPRTSWISRGVLLVGALVAVSVFALLAPIAGSVAAVAVRTTLLVLAALVMVYTGAVTSASAIPAWNSGLVPLLAFAYSLATGTGAALAVVAATSTGGEKLMLLQEAQLLLLAACFLVVLGYLWSLAFSSSRTARQSGRLLVRGRLALPFLGGALLLGVVVPFGLTAYAVALTGGGIALALALSGAARLAGDFALRFSLLRAGLYEPLL
ncbi:MAG: polysulfide reductase NrfD [Candidatus Rokubacteria bacterium]|nr:polysulfide reductase NrfD [Candidatus Rokubacteria bacterium]